MNPLETPNLLLSLRNPDQVRADLAVMDPAQKKEVSPDWLSRIASATDSDPWLHGFTLLHRVTGEAVGTAGFKAPPDATGAVEIAYAINPEHQGRGNATEAARALTDYAFATGQVRLVRAHTLPESNASTRVLTKCGFHHVGAVIDPEDGPVWRWEKHPSEFTPSAGS